MTFETALQRVTGYQAPLWSGATPSGGWLTSVPPGTASWWNYYPYGEMIFSVDVGNQALSSWNATLSGLDRIMPEVATGQYGLMQTQMLRDAATGIQSYADLLAASAEQASSITDPVLEKAGIAGAAADGLTARFRDLATRLDGKDRELTTGSPAVGDALQDAADALASFGRSMSQAWWDARPALGSTVTGGVDGLAADIVGFLGRHDLATPDGTLISYRTSDPAGESDQLRQLFRSYTPQGNLPPGMSGGTGSPADPAFWSSASAGITGSLTTTLQQLDDAADRALGELRDAYQKAVLAMGGTITPEPADTERIPALRRAVKSVRPTQAGRRVSEPLRPLARARVSALTPAIPATPAVPATPLTPMPAARRELVEAPLEPETS